jgi:hypothetical protein
VPFVNDKAMTREQLSQFILKGHPSMMLCLSLNVLPDAGHVGLANRKRTVAVLP